MSYAFGDSELASARLEMVARVFGPATRALLREAGPGARNLGVDLGCGPGHSTALLSEVLQCRRTVGLDLSAEFIERAGCFASERVGPRRPRFACERNGAGSHAAWHARALQPDRKH